jgi:hypothetical protein
LIVNKLIVKLLFVRRKKRGIVFFLHRIKRWLFSFPPQEKKMGQN